MSEKGITSEQNLVNLESIKRLTSDLRVAARTLTDNEARYMVDSYYMMQDMRIRTNNQVRALGESKEPSSVVNWAADQFDILETQIRNALDQYSAASPVGAWAREQYGVGPVIAAGLLAHIDIHKAPTVGHIWRYAGLDPTSKWGKGEKRPWNATLKTLCWKIGESFVKTSNNEESFYGKIYKNRKIEETKRNISGANAETALEISKARNLSKTADAKHWYSGTWIEMPKLQAAAKEMGFSALPTEPFPMLSPAHIHARARRYTVKIFLAHLHDFWWEKATGTPAPLPYPIAHLGHAHEIKRPGKE